MSAEADAFIGIPGGFGTLEELLEMVTWQQLGLHTKPVGVLNIEGYYDHLLDFFDHAVEEACVLTNCLFKRDFCREMKLSNAACAMS